MTNPQIKIGITANDDTKKGADKSVKTLGNVARRANREAVSYTSALSRATKVSLGNVTRTFGIVEKATSSALGNRSPLAQAATRLGALRAAGAAAGEGLGAASAEGTALAGTLGTLGTVAGLTVGVMAAAAYGAFKLADGWAKGAASLGRLSQVLGIAKQDLQAFQQAGEREGVSAQDSVSTLGNLGQTFNDAKYGRNNQALYMMSKLGVQFRTGKDGQLDTMAMTQDLADALARQKNAQARRMVAQQFGISDAALPMFLNGSKQLRADMADARRYGGVMSDADIATGARVARKSVIAGQMGERVKNSAGAAAARLAEPGYDATIRVGRDLLDGGKNFKGGVTEFEGIINKSLKGAGAAIEKGGELIDGAGKTLQDAANSIADSFVEWKTETNAPLQSNAGLDPNLAPKALGFRQWFEKNGFSVNAAAGNTAQIYAESKFNPFAKGDFNKRSGQYEAYGLAQWHKDRQDKYARLYGHTMQSVRDRDQATREQLHFMLWEQRNNYAAAGRKIRSASSAFEAGSVASREYERPADVAGEARKRGELATRISALSTRNMRTQDGRAEAPAAPIPVKVDVDVHDRRTTVKATAGHGRGPAISRAFADH